jgi:protein-tyrosine phosphatase
MTLDRLSNGSWRLLATTGVWNFRDYGGYALVGGGRLVRGRLFRSGEFDSATPQDMQLIGALKLKTLVDLRGTRERSRSLTLLTKLAEHIVVVESETVQAPPHLDVALAAMSSAEARSRMRQIYSALPFRPRLVERLRRYFKVLAASDQPALVCCMAGKDRTGWAVALVHTVLGVHRDDIFADYMLTNSTGDNEARIAALARDLELRFRARLDDQALQVVASVSDEYLIGAFDAVGARYGDISGYLHTVLQVTPQMRDALRAHFVEP